MMDLRYSPCAEGYKVFDWETGEILEKMEIINRLNRQNLLIENKQKQIDAMINLFNEEIMNSDGELKKELIRISKIELRI